jgi:hypothetical protein
MGGQDPSCALDGRQMSRAGRLYSKNFKRPAPRSSTLNPVHIVNQLSKGAFCSLNLYDLPELSQAMAIIGGEIPTHICAATENPQVQTVGKFWPLEKRQFALAYAINQEDRQNRRSTLQSWPNFYFTIEFGDARPKFTSPDKI